MTVNGPWANWDTVRCGVLGVFVASWSLPIAVQQTALGCLLACLGYELWRQRRPPRTPLDRPLAIFGGALLVSTLLSPDPLQSFIGYRKLWLAGGGLAVFVLVRAQAEVRTLLAVSVGVASVVAAYGILQHFTGIDLAKTLVGKETNLWSLEFSGYGYYRVKALHPSAITYAHNLLFPLALVTAWGVAGREPAGQRLSLLLGWTLLVGALAFSLTRGVWLAYAGVFLLCGALGGRSARLGVALGGLVCGLIFFSAGDSVWERARTIFDFEAEVNIARTQIWRANLDMIKERPLTGWGYGNYKQFRGPYYQRYAGTDHSGHAHNTFLQIWIATGLLGLAAFVFLLGSILHLGWRAVVVQRDGPLHGPSLGVWLGLVGFLLGGLTQYNWGDAEVALVWWANVGLLMRICTLGAPAPAGTGADTHTAA